MEKRYKIIALVKFSVGNIDLQTVDIIYENVNAVELELFKTELQKAIFLEDSDNYEADYYDNSNFRGVIYEKLFEKTHSTNTYHDTIIKDFIIVEEFVIS